MKLQLPSAFDITYAILILLILSIFILIAVYVQQGIHTSIVATNNNALVTAFAPSNTALTTSWSIFSDGAIIIFISLMLGAVVSAYFVKSHPIFFLVLFFSLMIEILLSEVFLQVFQNIILTSFFSPIANTYFTLIILLFQSLPVVVLVFSGIMAIVQYGKPPQD